MNAAEDERQAAEGEGGAGVPLRVRSAYVYYEWAGLRLMPAGREIRLELMPSYASLSQRYPSSRIEMQTLLDCLRGG